MRSPKKFPSRGGSAATFMVMSRPSVLRGNPRLFAAQLASRLLAIVGAASLAVPQAACESSPARPDGGGGQGMGGATSTVSTSATGGGMGTGATTTTGITIFQDASLADAALPSPAQECLTWPASAGACPTADDDAGYNLAIYEFNVVACIDGGGSGVEVAKVETGPIINDAGQCCYVVDWMFCPGGGRPYLVDDQPRVAAARRGAVDGWSPAELHRPEIGSLTATERATLAAAWTADALLEHASVASFARFSLALLAAGAPAELVALAHRAALDEIRHAQLCFALATAYAGEPVAPGPFPVGASLDAGTSLAALAASTVREGCIGETVAALVAAEQLAATTDPAVQAALTRIAADEACHAELAWRTVAWALQIGGSEVRAAVTAAFADVLAAPVSAPIAAPTPLTAGSEACRAHGRLDAAVTAQVVAAAITSIVAPAARALLERCPLVAQDLVPRRENAST